MPKHALRGTQEAPLIVLSVTGAATVAPTGLATRVSAAAGWARQACLATAVVSLGDFIQAMHCVATQAIRLPVLTYDIGLHCTAMLVGLLTPAILTAAGPA